MKAIQFFSAALTASALFSISTAQALEVVPYSEASFSAAQQSGKSSALHFYAPWCPTCRAQKNVLNELKNEGNLNLTVFVADYDSEKALEKQLNVRIQSTFIIYKGTTEKARLAGQTSITDIRAALKEGL